MGREKYVPKYYLQLINEVSLQLLDVKDENEVYSVMSKTISRLLPDVLYIITKLMPDEQNIRIVNASGFDMFLDIIQKLIGKELHLIDFPVSKLTDKQIEAFQSRKVYHFTGGIQEFVNEVSDSTTCEEIEKMLGIENVCAFGFRTEEKYYGGITLFISNYLKDTGLFNDDIEMFIETISYQSATVIQRLRADQSLKTDLANLRQTTSLLELIFEHTNTAYMFVDSSLRIFKINKAFCKIFNIPNAEIPIGANYQDYFKLSAPLFMDLIKFLTEIESLIIESKTVHNQKLTMSNGDILELDFIPIMSGTKTTGHLWECRDVTEQKKNEEELILEHNKYNHLINNLNDLVWKANGDGTEIIDLNNSFEKIYGYSATDFNSHSDFWIEITYPEDRKILENSTKELIESGKAIAEYRIIRSDGRIIWLSDRKSLIYDNAGNPIQMGGVATEITARKLIEEELIIKDFALSVSPIAIGFANLDGRLFYANEAYLKLWGYHEKHEVIGKHVSEFANSKEQVEDVLSTIMQGKTYMGEGKSIREDGTQFYSFLSAIMVKNSHGKPLCLMALFVDITDQKVALAKIQEQNKELEILNKTKNRFFSILAHDLKSPFQSMLGLLELLMERSYEYDTDTQRFVEIINSQAKLTFKLLNNLLEWAQTQSGNFKVEPVLINLPELIDEVIMPYIETASMKNISLLHLRTDNYSVLTDPNILKTILRNLINNAVKFTGLEGFIKIYALLNDKSIEITVSDNGVGMSNELINKLFKIDNKVSTLGTANETGTGLGLILCKELTEKLSGNIHVESELGKGTKFIVSLPV